MTVAQYEREMQYRQLCELLYTRQDSKCPVCKQLLDGTKMQVHHARVHNTKANRSRYPHLVDHVWNLMLVHTSPCHLDNGSFGLWPIRKADWFENRLADASRRGRR